MIWGIISKQKKSKNSSIVPSTHMRIMYWLIRARDIIMYTNYITNKLSVFPKRTCYTEEWDDAEDEPLDDVHEGGGHLRVVVVENQVSIRVHGDLSLELPMILREVSKLWLGLWFMYDLCVYQQSHARTSRRFVCSSTFQLNNLCGCRSLWQISLSKYQIS